ncbi:hypothetical protein RSOLAG1IB_11174 [Rhizoctonia solani AG-1 IB]|uniref:DUF4246 domain-containing protein n=1 Tax=Thanatephorus cucumeris (strain AG1-IB / isolate 7/3/14) TaxID=1108050 RepID=A0A0B7F7D8_THACB|nr:hypothetical protein RSOLAG1IB_11174 [Rhizoctonia solani AG-1 IB]
MQTPYDEPLPDAFRFNEADGYPGMPPAKTLLELEMTRLPAEIRRKPSWWTKYRDTSILAKWRAEAISQVNLMDESRFNYVLEEPEGYANLRDEVSSAEVS